MGFFSKLFGNNKDAEVKTTSNGLYKEGDFINKSNIDESQLEYKYKNSHGDEIYKFDIKYEREWEKEYLINGVKKFSEKFSRTGRSKSMIYCLEYFIDSETNFDNIVQIYAPVCEIFLVTENTKQGIVTVDKSKRFINGKLADIMVDYLVHKGDELLFAAYHELDSETEDVVSTQKTMEVGDEFYVFDYDSSGQLISIFADGEEKNLDSFDNINFNKFGKLYYQRANPIIPELLHKG